MHSSREVVQEIFVKLIITTLNRRGCAVGVVFQVCLSVIRQERTLSAKYAFTAYPLL